MRIYVTEKHIEQGLPCDVWNCPVALAIKDHTSKDVTVGENITIGSNKRPTSKTVVKFFCKYDEGVPVEPFYFNLPNHML